MSKMWIADLIFFIIMTSALVYSIIAKNDNGFVVSVVWSIFYLIKFIYDLIEPRKRKQRFDQEMKEKWADIFNYKGE